jgi:hypothetical protein
MTHQSDPCTSRGSNPDHRILSPVLSPLKVLVLGRGRVPHFPTHRTVGFWGYNHGESA